MLKISEFAKLAKTTRRTLIFYDEKGLFAPAKTADNGYRFYEADQLYQFELISGLRQLGLSLDDIQTLLSSKGEELDRYLTHYQQKIQEDIRHLQLLDHLLDLHKEQASPFKQLELGQVHVLNYPEQEFWCTDLAVDCQPKDVAQLYADFMTDLGEITRKTPSQLGFLTELALDEGQDYMSAAFRFIKASTAMDSRSLMTKITQPSGRYLTIKVDSNLDSILSGLEKLLRYAQEKDLQVDDFLWQLNTDQQLIKNGSSAQQVLQYRIIEEDK